MKNDALPDDVRRLVLAARSVVFGITGDMARLNAGDQMHQEIVELDMASEAFASRVPWEDEPNEK